MAIPDDVIERRFSVCQYTTWNESFEADLEAYAALGIRNIELCERKLAADAQRRAEQLAAVDENGLGITTVQPRVHALFPDSLTPDIADPEERVRRYRQTIDLMAGAYPGRELTIVTVTGAAPDFDYAGAMKKASELYAVLADYAGERNMRIALEPLSPILMNTDTFLCTLAGALELIDRVERPNFGLLLDVWHVWDEPGIEERIAALSDIIFGVHISDSPRGGPRAQADRCLPGAGVIDLPAFIDAVEATGYDGAYCLEIFSDVRLPDSLWNLDPRRLLEDGRDAFSNVWALRQRV